MYEHKAQPLAPLPVFYRRLLWNVIIACIVLAICLIIGTIGYHFTAPAAWIDAFHNSSMLLSGMGPVIEIKSWGGKIFSSFYALFSGIVFITNVGVVLAPVMHRLYHRIHLEEA